MINDFETKEKINSKLSFTKKSQFLLNVSNCTTFSFIIEKQIHLKTEQ